MGITILAGLILALGVSAAPVEAGAIDFIKKGSVCAPPTGTNNMTVFEHGYALPEGGITFLVNTSTFPTELNEQDAMAAIQVAANTWNAAANTTLITIGGTTTAKARTSSDGLNVISFGSSKSGSIAATFAFVVEGQVVEADVTLSQGFLWSTNQGLTEKNAGPCGGNPLAKDLQSVMTHEFGHVVGASHPSATAAFNHRTMYPFIANGELFKRTLTRGDTESIPTTVAAASTSGKQPVLVVSD